MTIIKTIKNEQLQARKTKDKVKADLLTTLLSEASMKGKNATPPRESTDEEVVAVVKKFIKNTNDFLADVQDGERATILQTEKAILETFLPAQLSEEQLKTVVHEIVAYYENAGDTPNMGLIMKVLKAKFDGQYDGKMASNVVKAVLG